MIFNLEHFTEWGKKSSIQHLVLPIEHGFSNDYYILHLLIYVNKSRVGQEIRDHIYLPILIYFFKMENKKKH
jgi:hypothetical protein